MRERTDVVGIQIGIGIQRIRVCSGHAEWELRSALVRSQYIPCTDLRYRALTTARPSVCIAHVDGARIPGTSHLSPTERQKRDLRPTVIPIVAYKGYIAFDTSKRFSIQSSNCEPEKTRMQFIVTGLLQRSV